MELGYLRRLHLETAGRVSFGERGRPAGRCDDEREALERTTNMLDEFAQKAGLDVEARRVIAAAAVSLMRAGY